MPAVPPTWRFRRMHPGEMNIDPIEAEFFSTEALDSLADALVREAVQNSLDARRGDGPLRMRFALSSAENRLGGDARARYLDGLQAHLQASRSGLSTPPPVDEPLSFLSVEDFGTRGLQGDPAQSEDERVDPDNATRNDFFYFWRNIGRSRKHTTDLGRWGLGKTVFQAASRVNAFFGLTARADDGRRMLLGQSVLKIHKLDGARYYPYGYFGCFEGDFALPSETPDELDRFSGDFLLERGRNDPGLSVVVPYPDSDITAGAITASVVHHYFLPIIAGDLLVEVTDGRNATTLSADSIDEYVELAEGLDSPRLFALARWGLQLPADSHVELAPQPRGSAPNWKNEPLSGDDLALLRARFEGGHPVALRVPVWVKPAREQPVASSFDVYLERDDDGDARTEQHFVRDGITIAGVRSPLPKGIRSLLVVRDAPLSRLLGDSENPAHTEWQERSPKFKHYYNHGPFTLRYVKNAPREVVRLLTQPAAGRDDRLLTRLFSIERPEGDTSRSRRPGDDAGAGPGADGSETALTVGSNQDFRLQRLNGGFRLCGVESEEPLPRFAAVLAAYDTRRGNPFRQWQPPDFRLNESPISVAVSGATVARCEDNVLLLELTRREFEVTVRGFDPHRDVRVRVSPVDDPRAP